METTVPSYRHPGKLLGYFISVLVLRPIGWVLNLIFGVFDPILKPISNWLDRESRIGPLMVLPAIIVILLLVLYPFGKALWLSTTDTKIGVEETGNYIGTQNFEDLINDKVVFRRWVIQNTLMYTFGAVVLKLGLGMLLAVLLDRPMPFQNWIRGAILLPWVVPTALSVVAWMWMLEPNLSVLNVVFEDLGVPGTPYLWLVKSDLALYSLMAVNVWRGTPFFAVTLLAALQVVPKEQIEAAEIDGANRWQRFVNVTVPTIMPVIVVTTLFSLVRTMADLEIIWILTKGGPYNSTHTMASYAYQWAFTSSKLGKGAAVSLFLFPAFLVMLYLQLRYLQRRDY